MPATRADLFAFLDSLGITTTTVDHRPVFKVQEGEDIKKGIPGGHTKNLFVKDKKSRYFVIVAEGHAVIDLKRAHEKIGASGRLSFGSAEKMLEVWGVEPGSVTLFGAINDTDHAVTVVVDQALLAHDIINAHPLKNDATTSIAREDVITFLRATGHEPLIVSVSEDATAA